MASGSSGRPNSGSKGFDFGSDDILCSYEDYANPNDTTNGNQSDSVVASNSNKDFHKTRMARPTVFPTTTYTQPDDSFNQDVASIVENVMKKHNENVFRFLEGLSSRLSQLELYCYNLDKSIGEMRNDLVRDHEEGDAKLKTIDKHLQEVHRSVQILRDKQELAETQKELAKLQLAQKDSSSSPFQPNDGRTSPAASESKKPDNTADSHNHQLAIASPHQVNQQQQTMGPPPPVQNVNQQQSYYLPPTQLPTVQHPQSQYLPPDFQYRTPQVQDISRATPQSAQAQVNRGQQFHQYQQQWPQQQLPQQGPQQQLPQQGPQQQLPQQVPQQQLPLQVPQQQLPPQVPQQQLPQQVPPPAMQTQMRPVSQTVYSPYVSNQPTNPPTEPLSSGMSMQMPYSGQHMLNRPDAMPYGYGGPGRTVPQQPPPQQMQGTYGAQPGDGYAAAGARQTFSPAAAYMMYDNEAGRVPPGPPQSQFPQSGYPPSATSGNASLIARNPNPSQFIRNHPYRDLIEKMMNMGFRGDHVVGVIQRMEESGQPVDFNSVLDRLNVHSSGNSQRGWSG